MTRVLVLTVGLLAGLSAAAKPKYSFEGSFDGRLGQHVGYLDGLSSERFDLRLQQNIVLSPEWSAVVGASGWNESVYDRRPEIYAAEVAHGDSNDLRLRNAFVEYKASHFDLKVGSQQVVWGEAIGSSFSDIVNPKDFRDGLYGDPSDYRLQVPMVNSTLLFDRVTLQGLYLPQPNFNYIPSPGNDFAFPYSRYLNGASLRIIREDKLAWESSNAEYGGRLSLLLGSWDLSGFYMDEYDRNPTYVFDAASTFSQFVVREQHSRVKTYGLTLTNDFGGYLLRFEAVMTENRKFPTLVGTTLSTVERSNPAAIIGLDFPTWHGINASLQISRDVVTGDSANGLLRTADQSILSARLSGTVFRDQEAEFLEYVSTADGGTKTALNYMVPTSDKSELRFGGELLSGPSESDFGRRNRASRVLVTYRYHFKY